MSNLDELIARVDWPLLAQQKRALVKVLLAATPPDPLLDGLLTLLDLMQDAAESDGLPVVWLSEESDDAAP